MHFPHMSCSLSWENKVMSVCLSVSFQGDCVAILISNIPHSFLDGLHAKLWIFVALLSYVWLSRIRQTRALGLRECKIFETKKQKIKKKHPFIHLFPLYLSVVSVSARYTCYISPNPKTKQCENPCCGTSPNQYCCEKKEEEDNR